MADNLSRAIELIKSGKKPEAGRILAGIVSANPDDYLAWQWLSLCVVPEAQKRHCLEQALRINPGSEYAKKALAALNFKPVFETPKPTAVEQANKRIERANDFGKVGCAMMQLGISIPILLLMIWCLWSIFFSK
jgi:hypothetical protein